MKKASDRQKVVESYVEALRSQGIDVAAVTDYNTISAEWFEPIRDKARRHGICVLPGVELDLRAGKHKLHVLVVFDADEDLDAVNRAIAGLDKDPATPLIGEDGEHREIDPRSGAEGALNELRQRFRCLIILPHPDSSSGFGKAFKTGQAARFLRNVDPDAVEHCPEELRRKLASTTALDPTFIDALSSVEFSDAHRIDEIGTATRKDGVARATYLKLSATDVAALELAFHDPSTRLSVGEVPPSSHPRIRSFATVGSGFLGNLSIRWTDDLNVIIGGRGAGKSAVIETLRYCLDVLPYADRDYRESLVRNALGSGGRVEILLDRPVGEGKTESYRVSRAWGEEPRVIELTADKPVAMPPSDLLGPEGGPSIFGQREIYGVAESEEYRLDLLDQLIGDEARRRGEAVRRALSELRGNARSIAEARERLEERDEHRERLASINHELDVYEKHGAADKLREASRLRADEQRLRGAADAVGQIAEDWTERHSDLLSPLDVAQGSASRGQSSEKAILEEAVEILGGLRADLAGLLERGEGLIESARSRMRDLQGRWQEAMRPLEDDIAKIKREAQTETVDPDRLLQLTEERTRLLPLIEELDRAEEQLGQLLERRRSLIATTRERRLSEHELRRERAEAIAELLEGRLQLEVEFKGQKDAYRRQLGSLLKGSRVSDDAIKKLIAPESTDGIALSDAVRGGPEELVKRFGVTEAQARRAVDWLTDDESRLHELETFIPEDSLRVALRVDDEYRPLERLSVGQRATAVLLLLFALEGRVLVLDQPEDDLDNRFVYEDVVQILRAQKGLPDPSTRRQIIAATHNANIPVLGDAELVVALESREGRCRIAGHGSIDDREMRTQIKAILEGGEEAFRLRARKYGGVED